MFSNLFPVVLCGGSGTRLWPLSRTTLPKQFIQLTEQSLFEDTLDRVVNIAKQSLVVCGNPHRFLVANMLTEKNMDITQHKILLEPMPKNTALAIALAAFSAQKDNAEAILLVLPSDHILDPLEKFKEKINAILPYTKENIITFGIKPNCPHTGYGYIKNGEQVCDDLYAVQSFIEKPNQEKAKILLENNASWNSGMFLMRADIYLQELKAHRSDIYDAAWAVWQSRFTDLDFTRFDEKLFSLTPSESIDYAVMEKTAKALVCPLDINWSDLGSFDALYEKNTKDEHNNVILGDVIVHETNNSYVHATTSLVTVQGLDNIAVVQTKDAVMVSSLDKTQEIKSLITLMKETNREELDFHCTHHRPWGYYESLINCARFQVKHITVKPKGILSKQMHHHRSEHWIVVKGTASVLLGNEERLFTENESIYIPLGTVHRLQNPGHIPLELIEVQTGSYLGEDDITRLDDVYGRNSAEAKRKL